MHINFKIIYKYHVRQIQCYNPEIFLYYFQILPFRNIKNFNKIFDIPNTYSL